MEDLSKAMPGLSRNTRSKPNPQARFRLFCFPYAGGGASLFRHWANRLPSEIEVYAVQLSGREDRLAELTLPLLRADFAICETYHYVPGEPQLCPIFACGGIDDEDIDKEKISTWREQTQSSFTLRMFPGDHFFLHRSQAELLQTLSQQFVPLSRYAAQRYG